MTPAPPPKPKPPPQHTPPNRHDGNPDTPVGHWGSNPNRRDYPPSRGNERPRT